MVFPLWQGLVSLCSWLELGLCTCPNYDGSFSHSFFRVGLRYLWKTSNFPLLWGWYGVENICSIPNSWSTWSMRMVFELCAIIWQYIPGAHMNWKVLVDESGHYGICWLIRYGKCFWPSVRWSIMVRMCLLPELEVLHSVTKSMVILSKDVLEFLSSVKGMLEHLLFLHNKVHIEWCISLYLCSCLTSSTAILLSNRSM